MKQGMKLSEITGLITMIMVTGALVLLFNVPEKSWGMIIFYALAIGLSVGLVALFIRWMIRDWLELK